MLSIIVPVYNSKPFLDRCLSSIPYLPDLDVILVNDGSTDGSAVVCEHSRFRAIHTPHNGVAHARNVGIEAAKGEFITFLDSDDEYLPGAVETMLDDTQGGNRITQYNHKILKGRIYPRMTNPPGIYTPEDRPRAWFGVWNKVFRADLVGNIRFENGLQYGEDAIFSLRCILKAGEIYHSETYTVLKHVDNKRSLTRTASKGMHEAFRNQLDRLVSRADPNARATIQEAIKELHI